jgi:hypothetical protein
MTLKNHINFPFFCDVWGLGRREGALVICHEFIILYPRIILIGAFVLHLAAFDLLCHEGYLA